MLRPRPASAGSFAGLAFSLGIGLRFRNVLLNEMGCRRFARDKEDPVVERRMIRRDRESSRVGAGISGLQFWVSRIKVSDWRLSWFRRLNEVAVGIRALALFLSLPAMT